MRLSLLGRYYRHQKQQGKNFVFASVQLPKNLYDYKQRMQQEGHQIDGYGKYDLPLLASYSRSGTNWLRYIIETISGRPTPGQVRVHYGVNFVIDRAHKAYPVMNFYPQILFVLRDYRECLIRHHQELWQDLKNVESFLRDDSVFQKPEWYIKNIQAFDEFQGPKLLLYYEDLLSDPEPTIMELAEFLHFDSAKTDWFIKNIDRYFLESVDAYLTRGHKSVSVKKKPDFKHHANKNLTFEQQVEFDEFYRRNYPLLYRRYLSRYEVQLVPE